ncbi:MAG: hypothetical protein JXB45_00135 [Candidatus Krumholzibacteriota bacterium]|nr:hypothetical protein [Candidatus Krumholzibacteriota bacterium]
MLENQYYTLDYDSRKNRVHWKVIGFWKSVEVVQEVKNDWNAILKRTSKGFTIIADLTEMNAPPKAVEKLHEEIQETIIEAGVRKVATVLSSTMTKWAVISITDRSGMSVYLKNFNSRLDAESWLDE